MRGCRRLRALLVSVAVVAAGGCGSADQPSLTSAAAPTATMATSATSPPATTSTTAPPRPERVRLAFTGDLLTHDAVVAQARAAGAAVGSAHDFTPMFAEVAPLLSKADLAVCHLEVPVSPDNAVIAGYPAFSAPRELGAAIAGGGYDACSTASNHSLDRGIDGLVATLDVLDADGVAHAGTDRTAEEAAAPALYETADGITVGHVSAAYGFNGYVPDQPWRVGTLDPAALIAAGQESRRAGADLVVASLHWGVERQHEISAEQLQLADELTASGAFDLLVGHHAHVVQPVLRLHDVPVIFGLGNFLSNMVDPNTRDGVVAQVRAVRQPGDEGWDLDIAVVPTWVDPSSFTIRPVAATLARPEGAALQAELRASWDRTVGVMTADGVAHAAGALPG